MQDHMFVDSYCGDLHDTRDAQWSRKPLRKAYRKSHAEIRTVAQFKATLRAGAYAWPGGYPLFFLCNDGGTLSFKAARQEARAIMQAIQDNDRSGWRVVACEVNYEDDSLYCDHIGEKIESAYGED